MSEIELPGAPRGAGPEFARILAGSSRDQLSGTLRVAGDPGGCFHLRGGAVVEVSSPGAPGVDTLLLRSGRVSTADWASAVQAGAAQGGVGAELVVRELVGAAQLQLICLMAALDGALAVGLGRIDGLALDPDPGTPRLAAPEGIEPEWLLRETERRITALNSSGIPVSPFHDRLVRTAAGTELTGSSAAGERREILLRADGRRTARDIAFLLGRSLYAVMVEVSRLLGEGLVAPAPRTADGPEVPVVTGPDRPRAAAPCPTGAARLPRRRPGTSGINDILPLRPVTSHWQPPPALLAKYRAADTHR